MEFRYTTLDTAGKQSKGMIAAENSATAMATLRARGLTVTTLAAHKKRAAHGGGKIKPQDIYSLAREVATLLRSGMRIDRSLELLRNSSKKQETVDMLTMVLADIKGGGDVAAAFKKTGHFSSFLISMIQVNEVAGNLQAAFENIAQHMKFQMSFQAEIRNAMTYPLFLVCSSILTLWAIFQFVVPRFFSIFGSSTESLPLPARILYSLSGLFTFKSLGILMGLAALLWGLRRRFPNHMRLPNPGTRLIHLPGVGTLIVNLETSRFCYSMYSMLLSGVEFIRSLHLSIALIQNVSLREAMLPVIGQIKEGRKIADVFAEVPFLPEMVPNMVRVGEESANLKDIFLELHTMFDERFKNSVKKLLTLVEPVIILLMGSVVGCIVITLILTVMSVSNIKL